MMLYKRTTLNKLSLCGVSEYGKIRTRENSYLNTFHEVFYILVTLPKKLLVSHTKLTITVGYGFSII